MCRRGLTRRRCGTDGRRATSTAYSIRCHPAGRREPDRLRHAGTRLVDTLQPARHDPVYLVTHNGWIRVAQLLTVQSAGDLFAHSVPHLPQSL